MLPASRELDARINDAVARALAGEASLETLICRMLFGRDPDHYDATWPRAAMGIWSLAVARYTNARLGADRRCRVHRRAPSLTEIWAEIEAATAGSDPWWATPISWPRLAARLGLGDRAAIWILERLNFRLRGRGHNRRFQKVPCENCLAPTPPKLIKQRLCPLCHSRLTTTTAESHR
jgi:hypothetical protein